MKIHFPVTEMTFLRYFIPVASMAKSRGHEVLFSFKANSKYNNPCSASHKKVCEELLDQYGFNRGDRGDVTVCVEGIESDSSPVSYALTYMYDFANLYSSYIERVNHVVFPSEHFAKHFDCLSDKNLYLGCPKYDVSIEPEHVYGKYSLDPNKRYALLAYPKARDMDKIDVAAICEDLISDGYTPIIKTRGKDPVRNEHKKYINFTDKSWFPHSSMEFITISDKIVNTGSSMIKEIVMLGKQDAVINYNIKPSSCLDMPELYEEGARKYLGPEGSASKRIIEHMEINYG
tara:strand:+ start:544 stop:1410 length:867 start_codon:yes stop_codon:yes gene_type:complete